MSANATPQAPQQPFPFHLYINSKPAGKTRVEKFGDFFHVLIEREDANTKKVLPPFTAVLEVQQLEAARQRIAEQLETLDVVINDLKSLA